MKIQEQHANGATLTISFKLDTEESGTQEKRARADKIFEFVEMWRAGQQPKDDVKEDPEKGKTGTTAYFSAEQDRKYDVDNGPYNYAPVIKAHSISLRVNEGVSA